MASVSIIFRTAKLRWIVSRITGPTRRAPSRSARGRHRGGVRRPPVGAGSDRATSARFANVPKNPLISMRVYTTVCQTSRLISQQNINSSRHARRCRSVRDARSRAPNGKCRTARGHVELGRAHRLARPSDGDDRVGGAKVDADRKRGVHRPPRRQDFARQCSCCGPGSRAASLLSE